MEALKATFLLSIDLHFVKSCHGQDQQNDKVALLEEKADSSYYENMKNCYWAVLEELRSTIVLSFRILCLLCQMNGSEHMKRNDIQIIQSSLMPSFYGTKAQPDSPVCMRSLLSSGGKMQKNLKSFCDSFLDQREASTLLSMQCLRKHLTMLK